MLLATAKTGAVYAPLNVRLAEREQRQLAEYLRPALVLHDTENSDKAAATGMPLWDLASYEQRLLDAGTARAKRAEVGPEDVQMVLLTGGTTGLPKGAMLPYRQGFYNAVNTVLSWQLRADDCVVQATPCYHAAVNAFTVPLFHVGGRVVLQRTFDPDEYLRLVQETGAKVLFLVPTMFHMVATCPSFARA